MTSRVPKGPPLVPREHGAYAQVIFPQLTALALGRPGPAALLLVAAIAAAFLAHEPILLLTGGRGGRAQREAGEAARRRLAALVAIGLAAGALGLWLAPTAARVSTLVPIALAALLAPLTYRRQEKTLVGELLVALTLSSALIPVAVAGGLPPRAAAIAAGIWVAAFAPGILTVRACIARAKKNAEAGRLPVLAPLLSAVVIALALLLAVRGALPALAALAAIPTALVALIFGALGVHPRNLRRMGWSLVASNIAVLAALVIGLR